MSDNQEVISKERLIDPRQQIIDDLNHMILPSTLTIRLYALALRQPHEDQIWLHKQKETLHQKNIAEVFTEILSLTGRPVKIKADQQNDFFNHLRDEAKQIEHQISQKEE